MASSMAIYRGMRVVVMEHASMIGMSRGVDHTRRQQYMVDDNEWRFDGGYLRA
jgi:hypothetical protein